MLINAPKIGAAKTAGAMKVIALLIVIALPGLSFAGGNVITATVAVTNAAGTTNGQTIAVGADVRTWTNSVQVPAVQILTNNTAGGAATNLFAHLANYGFAGLSLAHSGANGIALQAAPGAALTVTLSAGWGSVAYATNYLTNAVLVRVPYTVEVPAQQTNVASGLVGAIDSQANTNAIHESSPVAVNLVGLTNNQTIAGAKQFTNQNSTWFGSVSNALWISGKTAALTNGYYLAAILDRPTLTNGVNYGNAFSSPGAAAQSEQFGNGASALNPSALAVGYNSLASGSGASAVGAISLASALGASASGYNSKAQAINSTAFGASTLIATNHVNSSAFGWGATTTTSNQTMIGSAGVSTVVNNYLSVGGGATFANGVTNLTMSGTQNMPAGSDIAFSRYAITTLANGNNAGIQVGTNVFVEVSGPTAAFTINGINGQPNRDGKWLKIKNNTGQTMTIANESGTDPTAANRIQTGLSADEAFTNKPSIVNFIYDGTAGRWLVDSHN